MINRDEIENSYWYRNLKEFVAERATTRIYGVSFCVEVASPSHFISDDSIQRINVLFGSLISIEVITENRWKLNVNLQLEEGPDQLLSDRVFQFLDVFTISLSALTHGTFLWSELSHSIRLHHAKLISKNESFKICFSQDTALRVDHYDGNPIYSKAELQFTDFLMSFWCSIVLLKEDLIGMRLSYQKGIQLLNVAAPTTFYEESFLAFFRCVERIVEGYLLKRKIKNEYRDLLKATQAKFGTPGYPTFFKGLYKIRGELVAHGYSGKYNEVSKKHALQIKMVADNCLVYVLSEKLKGGNQFG